MTKTILIIDDEKAISSSLQRMIKKINPDYEAIVVEPTADQTFETATLLALSQHSIDLVFTDGELRSDKGIEYGPKIAAEIGKIYNIPIILMSGNRHLLDCYGDFEKLQVFSLYIEERLDKPFEMSTISALLKKFIDGREGVWNAKLTSGEEVRLLGIDATAFLKRNILQIIDIAPEGIVNVRLIASGIEKRTQYGLINPSSLKFQNKEELEKI